MKNSGDSIDMETGYIVTAPIFLLTIDQKCSLCEKSNSVFLMATLNEPCELEDAPVATSDEVFMLNYIESLPDDLRVLILQRHPNYKIERSLTTGTDYYMSVCKCGGHHGDHYVGNQIFETAFFNLSALRIEKLVNEGSWIIPCNYSYGACDSDLLNRAL